MYVCVRSAYTRTKKKSTRRKFQDVCAITRLSRSHECGQTRSRRRREKEAARSWKTDSEVRAEEAESKIISGLAGDKPGQRRLN